MKTFVTGSTGFIGSHLCKRLVEDGNETIALVRDIIPSKWLDEALKGCIKVRGDFRNFPLLKRILVQYEIKNVFHIGAMASVKSAHKDPVNVFDTNVMGTVKVLEACRQADVEKTLVVITDKVFGERMNAVPEDPLQSSEPYATSKVGAQLACETYQKTYGLKVIIVRLCNVYGMDRSNRIVPNTIRKCLREESPIIFSNETESVRQYIHIQDVVDAMTFLMDKKVYHPSVKGYNICTPDVFNQEDLVNIIQRFFPKVKPKYVTRKDRPKEILKQTMTLSKCGWTPKIGLQEGIQKTILGFEEYGY